MKGLFATDTSTAKRAPNANEETEGFPTGAADIDLFNGFFHDLGQEIRNVITAGGITPSNGSTSQLLSGINALIAAATGVGDTSQFLLVSQAAARLPIWPEVLTDDNTFNITSPGVGQARLPADVVFTHRGVVNYTTVQTDFTLNANRTYHLRWNPDDGWQALDLTDAGYNPSVLAEEDESFDTTFDDMLVARLVTNATNAVTITNLANTNRLTSKSTFSESLDNNNAAWNSLSGTSVTLNWGRKPMMENSYVEGVHSSATATGEWSTSKGMLGKISLREKDVPTRYIAPVVEYQYDDTQGNYGHIRFSRSFWAL